jgi:hypothetical protein
MRRVASALRAAALPYWKRSYGFIPATFFGDGYGQYSTDDGATWSGFDQPGGSTSNDIADVQLCFTL